MDFSSDNATGASDVVLRAIVAANAGTVPSYGADPATLDAERRLATLFERDVAVFLVGTGTAANALALAALAAPGTAIFCHDEAHVIEDENAAPEFYSGGARLVGIPGAGGKITPDTLGEALGRFPRGIVHRVQPAALTLSQATEAGTVYTLAELAALGATAKAAGLGVHMDGARFANALVELGATPAEMSWRAGVDILSFGATKNGALACEAVVLFDPARAEDFGYRRKRAGQLWSKGRYLGAQMGAYLAQDHWLDLARRSNRAAAALAQGLAALPGVRCPWARGANEVFAILPRAAEAAFKAAGGRAYPWSTRSLLPEHRPSQAEVFLRFVCSFQTRDEDVARCLAVLGEARGA